MKEIVALLVLTCLVCGAVLGVWVFRSALEARAFNAVTGKNVSTWQAMWIELRVQEAAK